MRTAARARVVLDGRVDPAVVETLLTSSPQLDVTEYLELRQPEQANGDGGDALILACAAFTPAVSEYIYESRRLHPQRPVLLVCTADTNGYVSEAIESGVDDIITLPPDADRGVAQAMSRQLTFTVEKVLALRRGQPAIAGSYARGLFKRCGPADGHVVLTRALRFRSHVVCTLLRRA